MGKRSTATTKSGKFMNPTDQARKQARRRELKRNKKQRKMVRDAVIKGRNPSQVIKELERLDAIEISGLSNNENHDNAAIDNEKVAKEKRKKLINNWNRLLQMVEHDKEHAEQLTTMRRLWHGYQSRRSDLLKQQESIRLAQSSVNIDDIPLPNEDDKNDDTLVANDRTLVKPDTLNAIPMPQTHTASIDPSVKAVCPGVPSNPPPDLEDYVLDDEDEEDVEIHHESVQRVQRDNADDLRPPGTSNLHVDDIQMRMLKMAGQDVDQYVRELEEARRKSQKSNAITSNSDMGTANAISTTSLRPPPPPPPGTLPPSGLPPPMFMPMFRPAPPPLRPGVAPAGVRPPPGPPPALRPPPAAPVPTGVVSAGPQIATGKVIEAKPQMRNLRSDITRFVPVTVKVKGGGPHTSKRKQKDPLQEVFHPTASSSSSQVSASKDDAYAQFMSEMNDLL